MTPENDRRGRTNSTRFHTFTSSGLPVTSLPSGANPRKVISRLCAGTGRRNGLSAFFRSHTRKVPSALPVTSRPSAANARAVTSSSWPTRTIGGGMGFCNLQILALLSLLPVASRPSAQTPGREQRLHGRGGGSGARPGPSCPKPCAEQSLLPVASRPSADRAREVISFLWPGRNCGLVLLFKSHHTRVVPSSPPVTSQPSGAMARAEIPLPRSGRTSGGSLLLFKSHTCACPHGLPRRVVRQRQRPGSQSSYPGHEGRGDERQPGSGPTRAPCHPSYP